MISEVAGIPLREFEEPIRDALFYYSTVTDERVEFNGDEAARLTLTPEKPNSARTATEFTFEGETAGNLYVIAFAPEDATGDEKTYTLDAVNTGEFPAEAKYLPRSKAGIDSEAHLAIATSTIDTADSPSLFAGSLSVLGLEDGVVTEVGQVGQEIRDFGLTMRKIRAARPTVSLTTGYRNGLYLPPGVQGEERFGDPHAILNRHPGAVQVCGFVAVSTENAARHRRILEMLGAREPRKVPTL